MNWITRATEARWPGRGFRIIRSGAAAPLVPGWHAHRVHGKKSGPRCALANLYRSESGRKPRRAAARWRRSGCANLVGGRTLTDIWRPQGACRIRTRLDSRTGSSDVRALYHPDTGWPLDPAHVAGWEIPGRNRLR